MPPPQMMVQPDGMPMQPQMGSIAINKMIPQQEEGLSLNSMGQLQSLEMPMIEELSH